MPDLVLGGFGAEPVIEARRSILVTDAEDPGPIAAGSEVLLPLRLWQDATVLSRLGSFELIPLIQGADDPRLLEDRLSSIQKIAIEFVDFNDGRGYTHAVTLRQQLGFKGQLRAVGDVLRDQVFYLLRCGFDAFEPRSDRSSAEFIRGYRDFRVSYQGSVVNAPLFTHRAQALAALKARP